MKKPKYEDSQTTVKYLQFLPANPGWKAVFRDSKPGNNTIYKEPIITWGIAEKLTIEKDIANLGGRVESLYYDTEIVGFTRIPGLSNSIYAVDDNYVTNGNELIFLGYEPPDSEKTYDNEEEWE